MSAADTSTDGACSDTSIERYVASGVGVASSLFTIVAVLVGRYWVKATHRFFLYYGLAAALHSAFKLSENVTCTNPNFSPLVYQSNMGVVSYFDGILVLLLCWISAYLLLVGAYQLVRLRGWKVETVSMVAILILPLACFWKPIYVAAAPHSKQTYMNGCRLPTTGGPYIDATLAAVDFLLRVFACVAAGITFAKLVVGSCQKGGSYHRSYLKTFQTLLPLFVFLLVANLVGFYRFALSVVVVAKSSCPALVDATRDLFPLTFVSLPVCYLFLVCKTRCCAERVPVVDSIDSTIAAQVSTD